MQSQAAECSTNVISLRAKGAAVPNKVEVIAGHVSAILERIGEDLERPGLKDTPARVARMYLEMFSGLEDKPPKMTTFPAGENDEMIVVRDITFSTMCEHHLLPFIGKVQIGYLPRKKLLGLSKLARAVEYYAARPQIQEKMTRQIADFIHKSVDAEGTIVVAAASHMCMQVRGVKQPCTSTVTSAYAGEIDKQEFFQLLKVND